MRENKVFIIGKKYVIKKAPEHILKSEKFFIQTNQMDIVEKIIKENFKKQYIVYKYIEGNTINSLNDVNQCLYHIYRLINQYNSINITGYGYIFDLKNTWTDFLKSEITRQSKYIEQEKVYLTNKILEQLTILEKYPVLDKKIIHGDLGCFNIICKERKIVGLIDPRTIIGDPMYDFIYFIFSNYNIATEVNLEQIFEFFKEPKDKVIAMLYILLYDRIAREQKNNTNHRENFLGIWNKIEKIERTC